MGQFSTFNWKDLDKNVSVGVVMQTLRNLGIEKEQFLEDINKV